MSDFIHGSIYPCPYCGEEMTCDTVDIGIGDVQCGPYGCDNCWAVEINQYRDAEQWESFTEEERQLGVKRGPQDRWQP